MEAAPRVPCSREVSMSTAKGGPASSSSRPSEGKITALRGVTSDITDRMIIEDALCESELRFRQLAERYRELVDSVDGIVWECDALTWRFSFVSEQAERLLGYPVSRWLEEPTFWQEHIHPEDREWVISFCRRGIAGEKDQDF